MGRERFSNICGVVVQQRGHLVSQVFISSFIYVTSGKVCVKKCVSMQGWDGLIEAKFIPCEKVMGTGSVSKKSRYVHCPLPLYFARFLNTVQWKV